MAYAYDPNVISRFFVKYSGTAPTQAQLVTLCGSVITAWTNDLKSLANGECELTGVTIEDLSSSTAAVASVGAAVSGTLAGGNLSGGTALVVSYEISRRYRGGHPRGYWPFGSSTTLNDAQDWTTGYVTSATSGFQAFFAAVLAAVWTGGGTLTQVNVSYFSGFTVVTNPITHRARNVPTLRGTPVVDTVNSLIVRGHPGSQRRRN